MNTEDAEAPITNRSADQHRTAGFFGPANESQGHCPSRTGSELGNIDAQLMDVRPDAEREEEGLGQASRLAALDQGLERWHTEAVSGEIGN